MRKIVLLLSLFLTFFQFMSAQRIGRIEFEVGGGEVCPINNLGRPAYNGALIFGEIRYNFNPKFDLGMNVMHSAYDRDYVDEHSIHSVRDYNITVFADYNLRQSELANVFFGPGIGWTYTYERTNFYGWDEDQSIAGRGSLPMLAARMGIEFLDKLRVSFLYQIPYDGYKYQYTAISIGLVFGGKKK